MRNRKVKQVFSSDEYQCKAGGQMETVKENK
jgi:hypothetical protein